jgi:hypothetical protein
LLIHPNGKCPDVPGAVDIAMGKADVSTCIPRNIDTVATVPFKTQFRDLAACFARGLL